jgi:hypothetical protein
MHFWYIKQKIMLHYSTLKFEIFIIILSLKYIKLLDENYYLNGNSEL